MHRYWILFIHVGVYSECLPYASILDIVHSRRFVQWMSSLYIIIGYWTFTKVCISASLPCTSIFVLQLVNVRIPTWADHLRLFLWVIKETHKLVWCWALDTHHIVLYMYMSNQYIIVGLQLVHDSYLGRSSSLLQWVIKMTHHFCSDILHAFGSQLRGVRPITVEPNPIGRESLAWTRTPR